MIFVSRIVKHLQLNKQCIPSFLSCPVLPFPSLPFPSLSFPSFLHYVHSFIHACIHSFIDVMSLHCIAQNHFTSTVMLMLFHSSIHPSIHLGLWVPSDHGHKPRSTPHLAKPTSLNCRCSSSMLVSPTVRPGGTSGRAVGPSVRLRDRWMSGGNEDKSSP